MKKFKFQLEALMTIREWNEQNARQALGVVMREIEGLNANVLQLEQSRSDITERWVGACQSGFNPADRIAYDNQILNLKQQSVSLAESISQAEERREQAMRALEKAAQEKRIVENMKEKRLKEYEAELLKYEANEVEDIFNARRKGVWS